MNNNPFETENDKSENKVKEGVTSNVSKKRKFPLTIISIIVALILIFLGLFGNAIFDNNQDEELEQQLDELLDYEDLDMSSLTSPSFVGDESLLGQGTAVTLDSSVATSVTSVTGFVADGSNYRFDEVVDPGVYTIRYKAGEEMVFGQNNEISVIGYSFASKRSDDVLTEFNNVAIDGTETFFIEAPSDNFKLEFIPQDSYIQFDEKDIAPGVYVAGQSIEPGKYSNSTIDGSNVNIALQDSEESHLVTNEVYPSFVLEEGDSVIIDNEKSVVTPA